MTIAFTDLERFYEELAFALDRVTPADRELYLTKLALLLAHRAASAEGAIAAVTEAGRSLPGSS